MYMYIDYIYYYTHTFITFIITNDNILLAFILYYLYYYFQDGFYSVKISTNVRFVAGISVCPKIKTRSFCWNTEVPSP